MSSGFFSSRLFTSSLSLKNKICIDTFLVLFQDIILSYGCKNRYFLFFFAIACLYISVSSAEQRQDKTQVVRWYAAMEKLLFYKCGKVFLKPLLSLQIYIICRMKLPSYGEDHLFFFPCEEMHSTIFLTQLSICRRWGSFSIAVCLPVPDEAKSRNLGHAVHMTMDVVRFRSNFLSISNGR